MMYSRLFILFLFFIPFCVGIEICPSREITASSGRITSPGYPSNYPSDTDCTLTIKQPLDTKITLTFSKLDIEGDDPDSCYDTLDVIGLEKKTFCATKTPAPYTSKLNILKLKMVSDDSIEQSGFDLTFTTVKTLGLPTPVTVCPTRQVTADQVGRIMSPSFPQNYGHNLNCKITLKIPANKKTEITFDMFSTEYAGGCVNDKLLISSKGGQQKSACGTGSPTKAVFEGDEVYVEFTTNAAVDNVGFMVSYKLIDIAVLPTISNVQTCVCPNGAQYIKRTISKNNVIRRQNDDISLDFKTTEANGLFLYGKGEVRDYILLKLENGNIVFEADLGTGKGTVRVTSASLNDNAWHNVVVTRRGKSITVDVDGTSKAIGTAPGSFSMLDIKGSNAALYALGGPSGNNFSSKNFKGCVKNLVVDNMKPIEAVQKNEANYALYGLSTLNQCSSN